MSLFNEFNYNLTHMSFTKNVLDACTVVHVMPGLGVEEKKENSVSRFTGLTV